MHGASTKESIDGMMGVKPKLKNMTKELPQYEDASKKLKPFKRNQQIQLKNMKTPDINEICEV